MISIIDENVFDSKAECIVNTINCVGLMGKGLALEFATRYPELEKVYIEQCEKHQIHTGVLYYYEINGQKIINFPTKFHYKNPSQMEWIEEGLDYFVNNYKKWDFKSIAFPLLGARNGGLDAQEVIKVMQDKLSSVDIEVFICLNKKPDSLYQELYKRFKECDIYRLCEDLNMNVVQTQVLVDAQKNIKDFSEIHEIKSIGTTSFKKIFNYLKDNDASNSISLF